VGGERFHDVRWYAPSQHNTGSSNRYGYSGAGESAPNTRFAWDGNYSLLADFGATPGGQGGSYLTLARQNSVLAAAQVPVSP
jgi:hypothetical protein